MLEKVLVIDDDLPSAQTLKWEMEAMGHEVRIASDGEAALLETSDFIPDIILCDIKLPGISGYEICRKLRANPRFESTLLLAQTGYSSHQSKRLSLEAGFHYHFVKPVDIDRLLEIVRLDHANRHTEKA